MTSVRRLPIGGDGYPVRVYHWVERAGQLVPCFMAIMLIRLTPKDAETH